MSAFTFASPNRVLDNIKRMELQEADLPSLPSIQPNLDYDSAAETSTSSFDVADFRRFGGDDSLDNQLTPHPVKRAFQQSTTTSAKPTPRSNLTEISSSASSSPFPPLATSSTSSDSSPYIPARAVTSTPHSLHSRSRRLVSENDTVSTGRNVLGHSRHRSDTEEFQGNSTGRERWHTPGEMSGSFSGDEILGDADLPSLPAMGGLGSERSVVLQDGSQSFESAPTDSPITKRLSNSHVLIQRPGRRSHLAQSHLAESSTTYDSPPQRNGPSPVLEESITSSGGLRLPEQDRIPSLSRSEISAPDTSGGASTPEAPSRKSILSGLTTQGAEQSDRSYHVEQGQSLSEQVDAPTYDYAAAESSSGSAGFYNATPAPIRRVSPNKMAGPNRHTETPFSQFSTPGLAREPPAHLEDMDSRVYHAQTPHTVLRDITDQQQSALSPYTPSPAGMISKTSEFSTPRAVLNDAERRKSHVLAVLNSTLPNRRHTKGTPHPLRRISTSPFASEQGGTSTHQPSPFSHRDQSFDRSASAPPNESFVSVASSADLTTDRRGTTQLKPTGRANVSFPTILLPGNQSSNSHGGSLRGVGTGRADGVKIHKHLNAMNKQLLESNADLAREAEAWRGEVERLKGLLDEAGVEVEDVDVLANIERSREISRGGIHDPANSTQGSVREGGELSAEGGMTAEETAAVMQELAEKLEDLEEILNEKDAHIVDLQDDIATLQESGNGATPPEVAELQRQLEESEQVRHNIQTDFASKTEQHAKRFGEICSGFEEQVSALERDLTTAKAQVVSLKEEKAGLERLSQSASGGEREDELRRQLVTSGVEVERLKVELIIKIEDLDRSETERDEAVRRADSLQHEEARLKQELDEAIAQLEEAKLELEQNRATTADLEAEISNLASQLESLENEQQQRQGDDSQIEQIEALVGKIAELEEELDLRDHQPATEELGSLQREIEDLQAIVEEKDAQLEAIQGKLDIAELAGNPLRESIRQNQTTTSSQDQASFVAAIEERLDEAYREIGRLKHELASSPSRKMVMEVRDAKIAALEREKAALKDRLAATKSASSSAGTPASALGGFGKPQAAASPFGKPTPFVHRAIASLRTPMTPGPLKELSWLQTTIGDANEPLLRAQLEYLQTELAHVNGQLDANFSRLEEAGLGGIDLAEKLVMARQRIAELEDEIRGLMQKNKAGLVLMREQMKERSNEGQQQWEQNLQAVRSQLEIVRSDANTERGRLQGEIKRLKQSKADSEQRSSDEIDNLRSEVEQAVESATNEVEEAKKEAIMALRETHQLRTELDSAKSSMRRLERNLADKQKDIDDLCRKHAREMAGTISSSLASRHNEEIQSLRSQLSDALSDSESLGNQLNASEQRLQASETRLSDLLAERATISQDLEEIEREFNTQRVEARNMGVELRLLQEEQAASSNSTGELERLKSESRETERELQQAENKLRSARKELEEATKWRDQHDCSSGTHGALDEQRSRFKAQTRELATQIRYLKAKFTREATFKNGLALQKRYLLLLVGGMSLNEQATLKMLATMGLPVPAQPKRKISFKAVGLAVLGLMRARNSAAKWKVEKELKAEAVESFNERRRVSGRS